MKLVLIAAALALSACSTWQPQNVHYTEIAWHTPCTDGSVQVEKVRIVDTQFPLLDCIRYSTPGDQVKLTLLVLAGFPPLACAMKIEDGSKSADGRREYEIFTSLAYFGDRVSSEVLEHELSHIFGMEHPLLLPGLHSCRDKEASIKP